MFKFLKDKIKGAISTFSKKVEEEIPKEEAKTKEEIKEKLQEKKPKVKEEVPEEKKGVFKKIKEKITKKKISEEKFDELFWDLELALLESNVALEVIEKIKEDLKKIVTEKSIKRGEIKDIIKNSLKESIDDILKIKKIDLLKEIKKKKEKPYVICLVGVNGSGKTLSVSKLAYLLQKNKLKCIFAASDTFRVASIEQLQEHATKLGIKTIKHDYGSDPAAVAFDAVKHAKSKNIDVVLIDTAGRMHSNKNLIEEMKKVIRVVKPDLKIFVGESIVGNDCIDQAKEFNEAIDVDGIILTKADIDEKGGAAVSVSFITKKPIIYIGTGQLHSDLEEFDKDKIIKGLGLD